jgi:transposase
MKVTTVGLDLAKSVFTLHGVDERGNMVLRKTVRRAKLVELLAQLPACMVGMEACSGAQHWARKLRQLGHDPRIMAAEYGVVVGVGLDRLRRALPELVEDGANGIPGIARDVFADAGQQLRELEARIAAYDRRIAALARASEPVQRLMKIGGVGPVTATALVASVGDARVFNNGRQFAAWLGLTPRQHSTGGKQRLGAMTKHGDGYLRTLLIHGARAVLRVTAHRSDAKSRWVERLRRRRPDNVAAVALAAKHARIIWALLARAQEYQPAA